MSRLQAPPVLYDRDDFIALQRKVRPRLVPILIWLAVVLLLLAVCILLLLYLVYGEILWRETVVAIGAGFVLLFTALLIPALNVSTQMWAARRSGVLIPQHFSIDDEGWRAESDRGMTLTRWPAVRQVEVLNGRLFVFISRGVAYIAPRRVFANDDEFEAFAAAVKEHWERSHRL